MPTNRKRMVRGRREEVKDAVIEFLKNGDYNELEDSDALTVMIMTRKQLKDKWLEIRDRVKCPWAEESFGGEK